MSSIVVTKVLAEYVNKISFGIWLVVRRLQIESVCTEELAESDNKDLLAVSPVVKKWLEHFLFAERLLVESSHTWDQTWPTLPKSNPWSGADVR